MTTLAGKIMLQRSPLFRGLAPATLERIAALAVQRSYRVGEVVFSQGDAGDAAYIVIEGEAEVLVDTPRGKLAVATMTRNAIIGEIAILCDVPRTATVVAKSSLVALRVDKENFFRLVNEFPQMAVEIMRELARRLNHTTEQLRQTMSRAGTA